ncbi:hypothetical protein BDM02DRAFT_3193673 [Thelephora ganbajun]|uniref:Uncharacterized protein n=1 Tax=Thelephora ganbajun TaxID=370292 RepID=A0ACB6YY85_THEGA|nr:hypothetical protein BDM02DRAFT_3193673 [Thelephora ganbajun]
MDLLHGLISLGLINWDGCNQAADSAIDGMRLAATLAERLLTLHKEVVLEVSTLARQAQMLASSLDLLTTFHSERLGRLKSCCFEMDHEMGEMWVRMMELELTWERRDQQSSSGAKTLGTATVPEDKYVRCLFKSLEATAVHETARKEMLQGFQPPSPPANNIQHFSFPTINPTSLEPYINTGLAIQATDSGIIFQLNWGTKQFNAFLCCLFPALFTYFDTIAPGFKTIPDEPDNIGMKRIEYMLPYVLLEKEYRRYNIIDDMHPVATRYKEALSGDGSNAGFRAKAIFIDQLNTGQLG